MDKGLSCSSQNSPFEEDNTVVDCGHVDCRPRQLNRHIGMSQKSSDGTLGLHNIITSPELSHKLRTAVV